MEKFFNYFDERYRESVLKSPSSQDGPVITISRQTGCDGREVAATIVENLNLRSGVQRWRWVDKDVIYAIARDLNIDSQRIENYYEGIKLSNLSEMIMAFSGGFVSDERVKKAIRDVVLSICKEGHIVLVGRGAVSIARNVMNALHIRLVAPFYWRVDNVMKKKNLGIEAAEKYIIETDEKRYDLIQTFLDKKTPNIETLFDASVNRMSFSKAETSDLIISMFEKKFSQKISERIIIKSGY
jgi:cytidylate kinase